LLHKRRGEDVVFFYVDARTFLHFIQIGSGSIRQMNLKIINGFGLIRIALFLLLWHEMCRSIFARVRAYGMPVRVPQ